MAGIQLSLPAVAVASERWLSKAINFARAVHRGVWLGLLDHDALLQAGDIAYKSWVNYLDESYTLSGLTDWEQGVVDDHFPPTGRVLVPFAGAGREVIALVKEGYEAVGFDPSHELVEAGIPFLEPFAGNAALLHAPADELPDRLEGPFDALLLGWGGYSHIQTRFKRVSFLSSLRELVDTDTPALISFLQRSEGERSFAATAGIARALRKLRRSSDPVELGDVVAATFDHYFTPPEIRNELAEGGFSVVRSQAAPYPHAVCRAS